MRAKFKLLCLGHDQDQSKKSKVLMVLQFSTDGLLKVLALLWHLLQIV